MTNIVFDREVPAPAKRVKVRRLTDEMKANILLMPIGASMLLSLECARSVRQFGMNNGMVMVQRKEDGGIRVWRLE